jgi:hypothetical protein
MTNVEPSNPERATSASLLGQAASHAGGSASGPKQGSMALKRRSSAASNITVIALLVAGVGFVVQMIAGVTNTPTIPPGLVAIVGAALLVTVVPTGWTPVAGPVAGLFNLLAMVLVGAADRLVEPSQASAFIGGWTMVLGLIVATIAGTVGAARNPRASTAIHG